MIKFYYNLAPNPTKVALALEEMGLPYELVPVDTRKGEQHTPAFLAINPNAKVPAIVDEGTAIFDSNAILLYLAEKTGKFLGPKSGPARGEMLSWLMFVASGIGPYSGQSVHFRNFAPEPKDYAVTRYTFERLPKNAQAYLRRLETLVAAPVALISTGADREETIVLKHPFEK